ncbi:MAG: SUMF1/EgtB/PvdO family nonheme iron enzyme [Rhabdochlamydiaceae bacterium]|nr:SUMF1/EgtB/PvdO family nonheme iron enzyme [Rhabdochlamydiaceae bacterium]
MTTRLLGDYELIQSLGRGSLGSAYLAEHRLMKRRFLVKILPPELASDLGFVERFKSLVSLLSQLEHPHLVSIHNVCHAEGVYFFVTDFVEEGCNLAQYLAKQKGKLSEQQIFTIATQLASALDYAHQKNEAHGSLKWNNIIIRELSQGIQVFISDFGLSRIIGDRAVLSRIYQAVCDQLDANVGFSQDQYTKGPIDEAETQALHHSFLQCYSFLAPEQKKSFSNSCDLRKADIYAFGVVLYSLLRGEFPEGFYELPTQQEGYQSSWDLLLARCLNHDPKARPDFLTPLLEEIQTSPSLYHAKSLLLKLKNSGNAKSASSQFEPQASVYASSFGTAVQTQLKPVIKPVEIARPSFEPDPGAIFQVETLVARYQPETQEEKWVEPILTPMQIIPAGSYFRGGNLGARDELPRHMVNLSAFALDAHPVTNEQFVRFLEAMGGEKDVNNNDIIRLRDSRIKRSAGRLSIESGYSKHPVVGVTWYGAIAYAKWIGKRLPTEAEWEIASLGGIEENLYPTGSDIERSQANFFSADTTAVMSYPPNAYGLYDMAGNVYEWCQDWYDYHFYDHSVQEPDNPKGPLQGVYRILRGGCWKSLKEDLRCAHRHRNNPGVMNGTYGFRCAADVSEE